MIHLDPKEFPELMCLPKSCSILYQKGSSFLYYNPICELAYANALNKTAAEEILSEISTNSLQDCILHGENLSIKAKTKAWIELGEAFHYVTYMETVPPRREPSDLNIQRLTKQAVGFVCEHYSFQELCDPSYIEERIEAGMLGAYEDGELVGFIGTHDSGSMGLLEVLPKARRKGIGLQLVQACIQMQLAHHVLPYAEIFSHNEASKNLCLKANMEFASQECYWANCKIKHM